MSDDVEVRAVVVGDEAVKAQFRDAESAIRSRVRAAMMQLGREAQGLARSMAPTVSGKLRDSIGVALAESNNKIRVTVAPKKVSGSRAFYAQFIEFGVVAHGTPNNRNQGVYMSAKGRKRFRGGDKVRALRVAQARTLGNWRVPPHPFMAPAEVAIRSRVQFALQGAIDGAVAAGGGS